MKCPLCESYCLQSEEGWTEMGDDRADQDERIRSTKTESGHTMQFNKKAPNGLKRRRQCSICAGQWTSIELPEEFVESLVHFFTEVMESSNKPCEWSATNIVAEQTCAPHPV